MQLSFASSLTFSIFSVLAFSAWGCSGSDRSAGSNHHAQGDAEPSDDASIFIRQADAAVEKCDTRPAHVDIVEVEVNQAVRRTLIDGLAAEVPMIARRPLLVRVYVEPNSEFTAKTLSAKLSLGEHAAVETIMVSTASTVDAPETTFNFLVPPEHVVPGAGLSIELADEALADGAPCETNEGALGFVRYPEEGARTLEMLEHNRPFELVLVPMAIRTEQGDFVPNIDEAMVDRMRDEFMAHYPISEIEVSVREPVLMNGGVGPTDTRSWSSLLQQCTQLRLSDGVEPEVFYHCMVSPGSQRSFCGRGCISGLATVPRTHDAVNRVGTGLAYPGQAESTAIHEQGHALGRPHAPCGGTNGVDPEFPNAQGLTDTWGYSVVDNRLRSPRSTDIMGYCDNQWISTYNYVKLAERLRVVLGADLHAQVLGTTEKRWWMVAVQADGSYGTPQRVDLPFAPDGSAVDAVAYSGSASLGKTPAVFVPFAEHGGGFIYARHVENATTIRVR